MLEDSPKSRDHRDLLIAGGLFAAALAGYGVLTFFLSTISPDGYIYLELARNLPGPGFEVLGEPHTKFLPLYPALMALLTKASLGKLAVDTSGHLVSIVSGALLAPAIYLTSRRLGADRSSSLVIGLAQMVLAVGIDEYRDISCMPLFTCLISLGLYFAAGKQLLLCGLAVGLAATTRFEAYLLLPFLLAAFLKTPRGLLLFAAGFVATASPWWARNIIHYGGPIHSYYMAELAGRGFHLPAICSDLMLEFGPVVFVLALVGARGIKRANLIVLAGFSVLYTALHVIWWFYNDRFLLPLAPVILPAAAVGLSRLSARSRAIRGVVIALVFIPLVLRAGVFIHQAGGAPEDPYVEAAIFLKKAPPNLALIGSESLILGHYSGHRVSRWDTIAAGQDPHRFLLEQYREKGVAIIVWSNVYPVDYQRFSFLQKMEDAMAVVDAGDGRFEINYVFFRKFQLAGKYVLIYDLRVRRLD